MKKDNIHPSILSILLSLGLVFFLFLFSQWHTATATSTKVLKDRNDKQKGTHVFGQLDSMNLQGFVENHMNWITLVPYSDQKDVASPELVYSWGDSLEMARRDSSWKSQIELAHAAGLKVFLKPHIWLSAPADGKWRSDIFPANEKDWQQWQQNYREYIVRYAKIAEQSKVDMFCIGTELTRLSTEKPEFWKKLIQEVRTIYSGKLTYAANWYKEYETIKFWEDLDYIGIQAYFPLVKKEYPSVQEIATAWNKYLPNIAYLHQKYNRQVLFTEMGYKSTADSAIEPWRWIEYDALQKETVSFETQVNCYEAFFKTVWKKNWFAGVHLWQMRSDFGGPDNYNQFDFTPQGKPAEEVIKKGFE